MSNNIENNNSASIELSAKEYYNFRLLALQYQIPFTVKWKKNCAEVNCEVQFLLANGYIDKVEF